MTDTDEKVGLQVAVVALPAACGILLYFVGLLDIYLFKEGAISARQAIGHELIFFVGGFLGIFMQLAACIYWLAHRRWAFIGLSILSALVFCGMFILAGHSGAAILNAT